MLKSNLILGIISVLMLFGLVGEPVSVSLNMPDSAQSNSEFLVEVTIRRVMLRDLPASNRNCRTDLKPWLVKQPTESSRLLIKR